MAVVVTCSDFRNLANMGKSKSLDTEDPPVDASSLMQECARRLQDNPNSCTETEKTRDLELNKVTEDSKWGSLQTNQCRKCLTSPVLLTRTLTVSLYCQKT